MKFKNNLRQIRFDAEEMSQQDLADRVGVSRMTIYSIEKEKYVPSALLAFKIAQIFDKKVEEVFYLETEKDVETNAKKI